MRSREGSSSCGASLLDRAAARASRRMPWVSSEKATPERKYSQKRNPAAVLRQVIQQRKLSRAPAAAQAQRGTSVIGTMASQRFSRQIATSP